MKVPTFPWPPASKRMSASVTSAGLNQSSNVASPSEGSPASVVSELVHASWTVPPNTYAEVIPGRVVTAADWVAFVAEPTEFRNCQSKPATSVSSVQRLLPPTSVAAL